MNPSELRERVAEAVLKAEIPYRGPGGQTVPYVTLVHQDMADAAIKTVCETLDGALAEGFAWHTPRSEMSQYDLGYRDGGNDERQVIRGDIRSFIPKEQP